MSVTQPPQPPTPVPPLHVRYIARFERLFRVAGEIDIDKEDLRHYEAFLDIKVADMLTEVNRFLAGKRTVSDLNRELIG